MKTDEFKGLRASGAGICGRVDPREPVLLRGGRKS